MNFYHIFFFHLVCLEDSVKKSWMIQVNANDGWAQHWQMDVGITSTCFYAERESSREFLEVFSVSTCLPEITKLSLPDNMKKKKQACGFWYTPMEFLVAIKFATKCSGVF